MAITRQIRVAAAGLGLLLGAVGYGQTTGSALQLTPQEVVLRQDDNTTKAQVVYTTDGEALLRAALPRLPEPNKSIVELVLSYPRQGEHTYWWPRSGGGAYDGATTDVLVNGKTVLRGESQARTFCCGLTLEVFYRYAASKPGAAAKLAENSDDFKRDWFCREINSPGPLDALLRVGMGKKIEKLDDALPGDFVQLWRNGKSGHSVIFVNWLKDASGKKVGFQYWSTQTSTNGIGYASEAFGPAKNQVMTEHFSIARPTI